DIVGGVQIGVCLTLVRRSLVRARGVRNIRGVLGFREASPAAAAAARPPAAAVPVSAFFAPLACRIGRRLRLYGPRRFNDRRRNGGARLSVSALASLPRVAARWTFLFYPVVFLAVLFEKVRNIEKRVSFETEVDKRRLHTRKNARHPG